MLCRNPILKIVGVLAFFGVFGTVCAEEWLPISPDELRMSREPKAPTASAVYLYRQVDRDDNGPSESVYVRIKILTEEGRKYADIEIPYGKSRESIRFLQARTIRPDGSIVEFSGTVFEKPLIEARRVRLAAKTFTLSDVQVGSIIEYRYQHDFADGYVYDSHWILSEELFTKHAKFSLTPYKGFNLSYSWPVGLPVGTQPPKNDGSRVRLEAHDIPQFVTEEHMPPENELKYRVDFIYSADPAMETDPVVFWKKFGKKSHRAVEDFVNKPRVMEQAVAQIVAGGDSAETKLRKIYARTQKIRNVTYERSKSEQEIKREAQKDARNVADVWERGYGNSAEITLLFLGLARAAGFTADAVLVSTRDLYFFNERVMNPSQLNSNVVVVNLDGKDMYFDPGTASGPFGFLPWGETGVRGLRLDKNGGQWIDTVLPAASESCIERKASLRLALNGTLEGKVVVTYSGLEAFWRRISERNEDEVDRKEFMEAQLQRDIPTGIEVKLINKPDWNSSDPTLVAEYEVKLPGWAAAAGQRALLPIGIFSRREKDTFKHASRVHPIYFNFPYKRIDDITIELPAGWQAGSLPPAQKTNVKVVDYSIAVEDRGGSVHIQRELAVDVLLLDKKYYPVLRDFFQTVRAKDEEQIVVAPAKSPTRR